MVSLKLPTVLLFAMMTTACAVDDMSTEEERAYDSELSDEAPLEVPTSMVLTATDPWERCSDNETGTEVYAACRRPHSGGIVDGSTQSGSSCVVKFKCNDDPAPVMGYDCPTGRGTGTTIEAACSAPSRFTSHYTMTWALPAGETCSDWTIFTRPWIMTKARAFCKALPDTLIEGTGMCCTLNPATAGLTTNTNVSL